MSRKAKIVLFVIIMLMVGCGKMNNAFPEENNKLIIWIRKSELLGKIIENTNITEKYQGYKEIVSQLIEKEDSCFTEVDNSLLDTWIGEYRFDEVDSGSPPMVMEYEIEIYKEEGRYFAEIKQMGSVDVSIKAEVRGDKDEICLLFREYLPDHTMGLKCDKGDIVLRLAKEEGKLHTYWEKMIPVLYENAESGRVYFTKKVDNNPEELSTWLGEYTFSEVLDNSEAEFERRDYRIKIYEKSNCFFAEVWVDGKKARIRIKAEVRGDEKKICLFLAEILPGHTCSSINKEGSILLKLRERGGEIYTDWGEIVPILEENQEYEGEYFKKVY